jgi:aminoglycoside phosphotransferase (APT) family kinase protein
LPTLYALAMRDLPSSGVAVERATELAGPDATVTAVRALAGGTHARTWLIQLAHPDLEVVLREFPAGDDTARHEAVVLTDLDGLDGLAPRLLASSSGQRPAGSWVLISRLPGRADITPDQPAAWAEQLGRALARIHATPLRGLTGFQRVLDRAEGSRAALRGPAASVVAARWESLADAPVVLTHYDFWSGNVVWTSGVLTGVVDWPGAAIGPRSYDVGWCRLDLYLLYGELLADQFLDSYEAASESAPLDRLLCDLWAVARSHRTVETWVPNYRDLGRPDLTASQLRSRHTAWAEHLLGQL